MPLRRVLLLCVTVTAALAGRAAHACGWDSESYYAEAHSLPCVYDAIFGHYPKHTAEYHETRIAAADAALAWAPFDVAALDDKAIALLKLGRLEESRAVMLKLEEADPEGYGTHANLGTLQTFTGAYEQALVHIDRAMAIEPQAHFGRERYHRQLVVFLAAGQKDPAQLARGNFLGLELSEAQRFGGSPAAFAAAGQDPAAFDALVSMIAVYGADHMSHLYFALGDLLALHGDLRLAWSAYKRASELDHPRRTEIKRWLPRLQTAVAVQPGHVRRVPLGARDSVPADPDNPESHSIYKEGGYLGVDSVYLTGRALAAQFVEAYQDWERRQLRHGLPVWRAAGMQAVYARQNISRKRCRSPGVIEQRPAGDVTGPPPAPTPTTPGPHDPTADRFIAALETAAQLPGDCPARSAAEAQVRATNAATLSAATPALERTIVRDGALRARMVAALATLTDAAMACRTRTLMGPSAARRR